MGEGDIESGLQGKTNFTLKVQTSANIELRTVKCKEILYWESANNKNTNAKIYIHKHTYKGEW